MYSVLLTRRIAAILVMATGIILDTAWGASWAPANLGLPGIGLGVNSLIVDPTSASTIYALTGGGGPGGPSIAQGLFRTTDGGGNWRALSSVTGVIALAIDPKNPSTIYAGTDHGVVKSTNGGESWIDAGKGLSSGSVNRLAIDPLTPSTLYAISVGGVTFLNGFGGPSTALFKSTDGGANWNALDTGLPSNAFLSLIIVNPVTPSTLYISASPIGPPPGGPGPPLGFVLKSTDGGASWNNFDLGLPPPGFVSSLTIDPVTGSNIYGVFPSFGGPGGIVKSTDGGKSWSILSGLPGNTSINTLVIDPTSPSTIYAIALSFTSAGPPAWGVAKSTDGGQHWNTYSLGLPPNTLVSSLAVNPVTPSKVYAGYSGAFGGVFGVNGQPLGSASGGVFQSTDGGQSWKDSSAGLTGYDMRTLAMNPLDANTIYAGGFGGAFQTTDGGANWSATGLSAYTGFLVADLINPNILYAQTGRSSGCNSSESLLLKTSDGGANWSNSVSPQNSGCILNFTFSSVHAASMVIDPVNPNTLYVAESDDQDGYTAVLRSTDGGANWIALWDWFLGLRGTVKALAIDPARAGVLYAGIDDVGSAIPAGPESRGLFKSTDGGITWRNTGFTRNAVNLLALDPSNSLIIYAVTAGAASEGTGFQGVFKSADGGTTWIGINKGLDSLIGNRLTNGTALVLDRVSPGILYLGTSNAGLFRSADGGATWSPFSDGLANLQVRALAVGSKPARIVYAATAGGVFKILDP